MEASNLFILSGGPGAGKSTVLEELVKLGFRCAPEVARQIIREQVMAGGSALPWMDQKAYTDLMLQGSIEAYKELATAAEPIFCDRGIPDTLGYARLISLANQSVIEKACRDYRYAPLVFLAPPWKEIYTVDSERRQDFAEAVRTYDVISSVYLELCYQIATLPKASPQERAAFIVQRSKSY